MATPTMRQQVLDALTFEWMDLREISEACGHGQLSGSGLQTVCEALVAQGEAQMRKSAYVHVPMGLKFRRVPTTVDLVLMVLKGKGEVERFKVHDEVGRLAKGEYRKRSRPQYGLVESTLAKLVNDGRVAKRYAPTPHDTAEQKYGYTYYAEVTK